MATLLKKVANKELSARLKLNYDSVYANLRIVLGQKASLFGEMRTMPTYTSWYADTAGEYKCLAEAPATQKRALTTILARDIDDVQKELRKNGGELAAFVDDVTDIPDESFAFYRTQDGQAELVLTGWGFKYAHQSAETTGTLAKSAKTIDEPEPPTPPIPPTPSTTPTPPTDPPLRESKEPELPPTPPTPPTDPPLRESKEPELPPTPPTTPTDPPLRESEEQEKPETPPKPKQPKKQHVVVKVLDQHNTPVVGERVTVNTKSDTRDDITTDDGTVEIGSLPYGESFGISFPDIKGSFERKFDVEPNKEVYEAIIKKLRSYSPVVFVEDQMGNAVTDYNVKVIIGGADTNYNSGENGVIQLPPIVEGQKFVVTDAANYANTKEFIVTREEATKPYRFTIERTLPQKVGISVVDKNDKPVPGVGIDFTVGGAHCNQTTGKDGRAEFPYIVFKKGEIQIKLAVNGRGLIDAIMKFNPNVTEYTIHLRDEHTPKRPRVDWKWLALIPLLLLLALGGYWLYGKLKGKPTIAEMESGVVMTYTQTLYSVGIDVEGISYKGKPLEAFYFIYDANKREIAYGTFEESKKLYTCSSGTGFLISKDGLIATNRHIADPIPPKEMEEYLRKYYKDLEITCSQKKDQFTNVNRDSFAYYSYMENIYKKISASKFNVKAQTVVSVAFTGTRVENNDEFNKAALLGKDLSPFGFMRCSTLKSGAPGTVTENDVAIIQLNKKAQDIPDGAYVFDVPEEDPLDSELPDDYDVIVLGYNYGMDLQEMKQQDGIKPQAQYGKLANTSQKYRIGYTAQTLGGSSGSPVLNKDHELVAVNNSGISNTQGFNYGVRVKYLIELLDDIKGKTKTTSKNDKKE